MDDNQQSKPKLFGTYELVFQPKRLLCQQVYQLEQHHNPSPAVLPGR